MAGIGFELNKLFKEKGISAKARAFGTSSVILAGPLLMGIALIILLRILRKDRACPRKEETSWLS